MLAHLRAIIILTFFMAFSAQAEELRFPALEAGGREDGDTRPVIIYSSIDIQVARPLIAAFQAAHPATGVIYHDLQTVDLFERILQESGEGKPTADLAISSAMDLQMKLVNDGYAQRFPVSGRDRLPLWSVWRDEAFGISFEPAVVVYHKPSFRDREPPKTRAELMALLEKRDPAFFGRVATYDVERSGLGLLFLARDAQHSDMIWRLVRLFGENGVKLYSSSNAIINHVSTGKFVLGYNLLGSYAAARAAQNPDLGIALLQDYTIVMSRIALIPKASANPQGGARFLSFILSADGQKVLAEEMHMSALSSAVTGPNTAAALRRQIGAGLRPIRIGPGLLVYLDRIKRRKLLHSWNRALGGR